MPGPDHVVLGRRSGERLRKARRLDPLQATLPRHLLSSSSAVAKKKKKKAPARR
jgi:hypothetical protein